MEEHACSYIHCPESGEYLDKHRLRQKNNDEYIDAALASSVFRAFFVVDSRKLWAASRLF